MGKTIPLIRAANVLPVVRWMETNNRPVERCMAAADLSYWFNLEPEDPIPVLSAIGLLRDEARANGPDLGYQIVTEASIGELAYIGRVALGSRTPREALTRVASALVFHSSHEDIRLSHDGAGLQVRETFRMKLDPESLHAIHVLFSSMMLQLCLFTGLRPPLLEHIAMQPHPTFGVAHLQDSFGARVVASKDQSLTISLSDAVANAQFRVVAKDRLPQLMAMRIPPLAEDNSLAGSMRPVIAAMLHGGEPTVERVARAGGMSVRSLQRRLTEEGTNFSDQLSIVRRGLARKLLLEQDASLWDISERLGYSSQSALTRAVRRWTGTTPSWIRNRQTS
jgi:AraC-like DNA-binding protein